jgi:hypothetical protein
MKEWVIGAPYTTETVLTLNDTTLIIACDGVFQIIVNLRYGMFVLIKKHLI